MPPTNDATTGTRASQASTTTVGMPSLWPFAIFDGITRADASCK